MLSGRSRAYWKSLLTLKLLNRQGRGDEAALAQAFASLRDTVLPPMDPIPPADSRRDLHLHLQRLRGEFQGMSALCFHHAELIVHIRRGIRPAHHIPRFMALWRLEGEFLCRHLDSRWLVAALDTFADYGTPVQRGIAAMQTALLNTLKLAETEHLLLGGRPGVDALVGLDQGPMVELWDGMESFNVARGDMLRNLLERLGRVSAQDPGLDGIFRTLMLRADQGNNLLSRMRRANRYFRATGSGVENT